MAIKARVPKTGAEDERLRPPGAPSIEIEKEIYRSRPLSKTDGTDHHEGRPQGQTWPKDVIIDERLTKRRV